MEQLRPASADAGPTRRRSSASEFLVVLKDEDQGERAAKLKQLEVALQTEAVYLALGLAEKIAPDGQRVRRVGFTATTNQGERRVALSPRQKRIRGDAISPKPTESEPIPIAEVQGILLEADATSLQQGRIQVVDDDARAHRFNVPRGMMSDIVKPMFEERVIVTAQRKGKHLLLESIVIDEGIESDVRGSVVPRE